TPFVLSSLKKCSEHRITTGCIVSNPDSPIAKQGDHPVEVITGAEGITGSTRMECGTAQNMIVDTISTPGMSRVGRVTDNELGDVKLINNKITDRAVHILMDLASMDDYDEARALLLDQGSVDKAIRYRQATKGTI